MLTIEISDNANALPQWAVRRPRANMIDPPMTDLLGIESVTSTEDNPETLGTKDDTSNDEHIARLEQQIADLQGKVERVRNFGKLPVSNNPPQETRTTAHMPPHFPSLELLFLTIFLHKIHSAYKHTHHELASHKPTSYKSSSC
ncbi:hypothetical protein KY290_012076 [Solanum tuberosum]|uniref:Integrase core domain containing protein n=1 Tax=Solanum tuberosum TaxID=4113 RepID=A0ABQ7W2G3_SOLTU|nr:hypothetical protein KY289_010273 [Solanum tuberosum]KAH0774939.1 hypothetical protein KY290_012076 [Solanum tuberosum]